MNNVRNSFFLCLFLFGLSKPSPNPKRSFDHTINPQKLTHGFLWAIETMQAGLGTLLVGFGAEKKLQRLSEHHH